MKWNFSVDISKPYEQYEYGEIDLSTLAKQCQQAFFQFIERNPRIKDFVYFDYFEQAVNDMNLSETEQDFDCCLAEIYEFADENRIWINTMGVA